MLGECAVSAIHAAIVKREMGLHNAQVPASLGKFKIEFVQKFLSNLHKREIKILKWTGVAVGLGCSIAGVIFSVLQLKKFNEAKKVAEAAAKAALETATQAAEEAQAVANAANVTANAALSQVQAEAPPETLTEFLNGHTTITNQIAVTGGLSLLGLGTCIGLTVRCVKTGACAFVGRAALAAGKPIGHQIARPFHSRRNRMFSIPSAAVLALAYPAYKVAKHFLPK
jgi:hypothetical protein